MNRRKFLSLCGVAAGGAGCQGGSDTTTVTPVPSPITGEPTPSRPAVEVTDAEVVPAVVRPGDDSLSVATTDGQYLVLTVEGTVLDRTAFSFRFDGSGYDPMMFRNGLYRDGEWGKRFTDRGGPLVFALPETGANEAARLVWPGGEWTPPEAVSRRLEAPLPTFDITLSGPTRVTDADEPTLELTVANTGAGPGRYVVALNRIGPRVAYAPVGRFDGSVGPGETEVISHDATSPYDGGGAPREVRYKLDAPGERNDAEHRMRPVEEPTVTET